MVEAYEIIEFLPKVISETGCLNSFDTEKLALSVHKRTKLDIATSNEIVRNVLVRVNASNIDSVNTRTIEDLVCAELSIRNMFKERKKYLTAKRPRFVLDETFIDAFTDKQPRWGPVGYITYKRTYARYIPDLGRSEEWYETLRRVVEGSYSIQKIHYQEIGLEWNEEEKQQEAQIMYLKMWQFKLLPPGRGLWIMGTGYMYSKGSMALNNCGFVSTKHIKTLGSKIFKWFMDALMLGVGAGFDVLGAGKLEIKPPKQYSFEYEVPDSREGWTDGLQLLLDAYFKNESLPSFNFNKVRPAGARIKQFGGVSGGPGPLKEMYDDINILLSNRIGETLSSIDIVDIMNLIGKCVVSGNVRRSAEIALGNMNDEAYITCKQDQEALYHHRWASNNSVYAKQGMDYSPIVKSIEVNGEPGIFFVENAQAFSRVNETADWKDRNATGVNPCGEMTLSSFELCCLVETFPVNHENYADYQETLRYAHIYTKSVTLLNTHWHETNVKIRKNRRIGVSQTGIIDAIGKFGRREILNWCDKGYKFLKQVDKDLSDKWCIPESIKITTVKPSGTVSLLPGVSPGIHYPHAPYYIRRIRIAANSELVELLQDANYPYEKDAYANNTLVFEVPVKQLGLRYKNEVSIWEQVANAVDYQKYWSDNQVSITVNFKEHERDQIIPVLQFVEDKLKGITFFPDDQQSYKQLPYEEISKEEYEQRIKVLKPIKYKNVATEAEGVRFCDGDKCNIF